MRRKILCLFVATSVAACSPDDGGIKPANSSSSACQKWPEGAIVQASAKVADPFETRGKVILEGVLPLQDSVLPKGTRLGIKVSETCRSGGEISSGLSPALTTIPTPSGVRSYTWTLPRDYTLAEIQEVAENDECIVGISDSVVAYTTQVIDDPLVPEQGHLQSLKALEAFALAFSQPAGETVTIAVIDTGIDLDHDDLSRILWRNEDEVPDNGVDDDKNGYVDDVHGYNFALDIGNPEYVSSVTAYQHGTHVSGLAAAQGGNALGIAGTMPVNTRIMTLNVFGNGSGALSSDIANAIRYAADNGADVINMSLGGSGRSAEYESALAYAINKGVVIFAAAGNDGRQLSKDFFMSPASYAREFPGMMAVGSIDSVNGQLSSFSNFGPDFVQIAAPGSDDSKRRIGLLSTWPGNRYQRTQGTSMSTPVAAGAAALTISLMRSRGYATTPELVQRILEVSARKDTNLSDKIKSGNVLDLKSLVEYITDTYPVRVGAGSPTVPPLPPDC